MPTPPERHNRSPTHLEGSLTQVLNLSERDERWTEMLAPYESILKTSMEEAIMAPLTLNPKDRKGYEKFLFLAYGSSWL